MKRKLLIWTFCLVLGVLGGHVNYRLDLTAGKVAGTAQQSASGAVVDLVIDNNDGGKMDFRGLQVEEGATALSLLQRVAEEEGLSLEVEKGSLGEYINAIGGKEADQGHYWSFWINGQMSAQGAGSYHLRNEDDIIFRWSEL